MPYLGREKDLPALFIYVQVTGIPYKTAVTKPVKLTFVSVPYLALF